MEMGDIVFLGGVLCIGGFDQVVAYQVYENLLVITTDPFSIDYSETSRFYYGSLWLSQSLYGMRVPLLRGTPRAIF